MWYKMSLDLLNSAVMRELGRPVRPKDTSAATRKFALIRLLALTSSGNAMDIQDERDLADILDLSEPQAKVVWDILIKHGVLRENFSRTGKNAKDWMVEQRMMGDTRGWPKFSKQSASSSNSSKSNRIF